ncbi:hypothetical protein ACFOPX_02460 [Helicobacter baculiformis]|uniref:Lipoprotein n=1 Tax=Helicobacter baculiformis TaxID=427351 RepID=A0ABV7ZID3_9HELI|nr:hypothetical protein [Helicobacter baculiformis]
MKTRVGVYGCMALGAVLLGCANTQSRDQLAKFHNAYYAKQNQQADKFAKNILAKDKKQVSSPLWELQDGVNAFMMSNYKDSLSVLDKANKAFDTNLNNMAKGIAKAGAATFGSATNIPYEGHMYEWALTNYYMALDYAFMGNFKDARVEFNRTMERQRRIKDVYTKEIQKTLDDQGDAKKKDANKFKSMTDSFSYFEQQLQQRYAMLEKARESKEKNATPDKDLSAKYSSLKSLAAYEGFINPLVSYVAGLFYGISGDSKGIDGLKEAYAVSKASVVAQDIKYFEGHSKEKITWIIVEDGAQPTLEEYKNANLNYALPLLKPGVDFHSNFTLSTGTKVEKFEILSHFDGVVQAEYQKTLPAIKARAITSAILKTGAGKGLSTAGAAAGGETGMALMAAGGIMHAINKTTTAADTRGSTIFPNTIYVARVRNSKAPHFSVKIDAMTKDFSTTTCNLNAPKQQPNQVCSNTNNIIFIRTFQDDSNIKVLSF